MFFCSGCKGRAEQGFCIVLFDFKEGFSLAKIFNISLFFSLVSRFVPQNNTLSFLIYILILYILYSIILKTIRIRCLILVPQDILDKLGLLIDVRIGLVRHHPIVQKRMGHFVQRIGF